MPSIETTALRVVASATGESHIIEQNGPVSKSNQLAVLAIEQRVIGFKSTNPSRQFVLEAEVKCFSSYKCKKGHLRTVILFDDLVLITSRKGRTLLIKHQLGYREFSVRDLNSSRNEHVANGLELFISQADERVVIRAENSHTHQSLMNELSKYRLKCINEAT